jgi:hypothetical protein
MPKIMTTMIIILTTWNIFNNIIITHANWLTDLDWQNEWGMLRVHPHFLLTRAWYKEGERERERWREGGGKERKRESGRDMERERERKRERERERGREGERERDVEYGCFILIFKRNDGCLGTFSYLVFNTLIANRKSHNKNGFTIFS